MRHIFHEVLTRYLASEQHAFDTSHRELWPESGPVWHPPATRDTGSPAPERGRHQRVYRELEPQN
jgi:hypothetical protein